MTLAPRVESTCYVNCVTTMGPEELTTFTVDEVSQQTTTPGQQNASEGDSQIES